MSGQRMTKIIIFTDLHLVPEGGRIIGLDPYARLLNGIRHVNRFHADAAQVVLMGDLAHCGDQPSYLRLRQILDQLEPPQLLMIGNHDHRPTFQEAFPEAIRDDNGFVQGVVDIDSRYRLVFLDTVNQPLRHSLSEHAGHLCRKRLGWLADRMRTAGHRSVVIFMHHPPHATGFVGMDALRLGNEAEFYRLLATAGNVRHIFAGHVHRTISGSCRGIPFSVFKSPVHQQPMTFDLPDSSLSVDEPAAYGIVFLRRNSILVHTEDYEISQGSAR
jgi:3',5'-cyclic-AMP phosphodiesterase